MQPNEPRCPECKRPFQIGKEKCMWCGALLPEVAPEALSLTCPQCNAQMTEQRQDWMRAYLCPSGCGLWMPAELMKRLEKMHKKIRSQQPQRQVRDKEIAAELRMGFEAENPEALYRHCPQCSNMMSRKRYQRVCNVVVDECLGHGVWFDPGEFELVVEFLKSGGLERAAQAKFTLPPTGASLSKNVAFVMMTIHY